MQTTTYALYAQQSACPLKDSQTLPIPKIKAEKRNHIEFRQASFTPE